MLLYRQIVGVVLSRCIYAGLAVCAWFQPAQAAAANAPEVLAISTNPAPAWPNTNGILRPEVLVVQNFDTRLATARYLEKIRQPDKAEPVLVSLLVEGTPDAVRQDALCELASAVTMENDLPRAEAIYAQYLDRWPNDPRVPEILLREGQAFRQMGLNSLALAKFYAVMTSALSLKNNQFQYYQHLVLRAQVEIAETHYLMGQFAEAADFCLRLMKQDDPTLNRPQTQFRLIRSLTAIEKYDEAVGQARDFLSHYPDAPEEPEARFYLAQALKRMGQNEEALQQVLLLLQEEKAKTKDHPEIWAYWQQRAGNEIANQLYSEGDYVKALDIYMSLAQLDSTPAWQLPVQYQIGIIYERLLQPQKAVETYNSILQRESDLGTNASPDLQTVCDMARWRASFLKWQGGAEQKERFIASELAAETNSLSKIP
ncbi:MAG TPA: tetratricopeptide repeat protein [Candidatus Sulfopaludibacter sp.]|nr:tetratricopeptide repeat protein [Candidatus Sulfopaludibacter sp.]